MWCSAADSQLKLLNRVVSGVQHCFLAGGVLECNLAHRRPVAELCMLLRVTQCIIWALHCVCLMCWRVLLVVHWLLTGTRSCLLVVGFLSITEPFCPSRCLFGMILVILCSMVWDWRASRAEPMLSCWHDLLFLFCLLLFYLFLPSMGWLCGVGVFGLIDCSHSLPALHSWLQFNNNNINNERTWSVETWSVLAY